MAGWQEEKESKTVHNPSYARAQQQLAEAPITADDVYEFLLQHADTLIHGARNTDYGHPLDDFCDTADYWTTWGRARGLLVEGAAFAPEDVPMMMVLLKISREGRRHKYDNILDAAGYLGTFGMVVSERTKRRWGKIYEVVQRLVGKQDE